MTDKERILIQISAMTAYATTEHRLLSENTVKWEHINENTPLKKGDIVCGMTNPNHKFGVAFFEERTRYGDFVVKEIGTNKTCNYTNEMFLVLRNFPDMYKLCGIEHLTMLKIKKALYNIDHFRFVRVEFEQNKLIITVRKKWTSDLVSFNFEYSCPISKITIKSLKTKIEAESLACS
ncbi:MAG: hypothetical protein WC389_06605 [Lutibacter sp.]|jgi:hypothetical protein